MCKCVCRWRWRCSKTNSWRKTSRCPNNPFLTTQRWSALESAPIKVDQSCWVPRIWWLIKTPMLILESFRSIKIFTNTSAIHIMLSCINVWKPQGSRRDNFQWFVWTKAAYTWVEDLKYSPLHSWEEHQPLRDLVQKKPFFLVEWFSVEDLLALDANEKCRLKKGFAKELFMLELKPIFGPFPSLPPSLKRSNIAESPSRSLSTTRLLNFLFLAFKSISVFKAFWDSLKACFSPKVQNGHAGSYLSISGVRASKHSAW